MLFTMNFFAFVINNVSALRLILYPYKVINIYKPYVRYFIAFLLNSWLYNMILVSLCQMSYKIPLQFYVILWTYVIIVRICPPNFIKLGVYILILPILKIIILMLTIMFPTCWIILFTLRLLFRQRRDPFGKKGDPVRTLEVEHNQAIILWWGLFLDLNKLIISGTWEYE